MWYMVEIATPEPGEDPIGEEPYSATLEADGKQYNVIDLRCIGLKPITER